MTSEKPIVEMFGEVVAATEAKLLAYLKTVNSTIQQIHYEYGHPKEIIRVLATMSDTREYEFKKYPLVALFQDFPEDGGRDFTYKANGRFTVIIANQTEPTYTAEERYTKNFKPLLYPIYEELINQLSRSRNFLTKSRKSIVQSKIDRPFWGREGLYGNEANKFGDNLDCIEIRNLELKVRYKRCTLPQNFKNF